ncbi:TIGR02117 family protein [Crocinitomicaceae bacterium]|nr:TIGR02117 family protein [Crocinitomicaceae bacterium]
MIWRILTRAWLSYISVVVEVLFAFILAFLVFAFYGEAIPVGNQQNTGDVYFYVRSNGIHTEICFPVKNEVVDWTTFLSLDDYEATAPQEFISVGWGDKGFYMNTPEWSDLTLGTAFTAIAIPSPTAMHVGYEYEPLENEHCYKVRVTRKQYKNMASFVRESFKQKGEEAILISGKGYGDWDNFYEANDNYHLFRTCNTWTNEVLKQGDVRTALFAVFPNAVMGHLR